MSAPLLSAPMAHYFKQDVLVVSRVPYAFKNSPYNISVVYCGFPIIASNLPCASFVGGILSDIDEYIYSNNIMVGYSIRVH